MIAEGRMAPLGVNLQAVIVAPEQQQPLMMGQMPP